MGACGCEEIVYIKRDWGTPFTLEDITTPSTPWRSQYSLPVPVRRRIVKHHTLTFKVKLSFLSVFDCSYSGVASAGSLISHTYPTVFSVCHSERPEVFTSKVAIRLPYACDRTRVLGRGVHGPDPL